MEKWREIFLLKGKEFYESKKGDIDVTKWLVRLLVIGLAYYWLSEPGLISGLLVFGALFLATSIAYDKDVKTFENEWNTDKYFLRELVLRFVAFLFLGGMIADEKWSWTYRYGNIIATLLMVVSLSILVFILFDTNGLLCAIFSRRKRHARYQKLQDELARDVAMKERKQQQFKDNREQYEQDLLTVCRDFQFDFDFYQQPIDANPEATYIYELASKLSIDRVEDALVWLANEDRLAYYDNLIRQWYEFSSLYEFLDLKPLSEFEEGDTLACLNHLTEQLLDFFERFGSNYPESISDVGAEALQRVYYFADFIRSVLRVRKDQITQDYRGMSIGLEGETAVNEELKPHANLINLPNIRVEVEGESVENDNILLTRHGIYTLEVKNFGLSGRFDIVIESDGRWLRRYEDGHTEVMKNVTSQSNRHIGYLNRLINDHFKTNLETFIEVKGLIVVANDRVKIENHNPRQVVLRKADIYNHITSQDVCLTLEQINELQTLLMNSNLPPLKFSLPNLEREFKGLIMPALEFCRKIETDVKSPFVYRATTGALENLKFSMDMNQEEVV